jgi:hypothetical protein
VSLGLLAGLVLALASTVAFNWGLYAQHTAASSIPPLSLRSPFRSLAELFGNRRWLAGFAADLAGWPLYVAALALAPLSIVQAAAAGGIGVLAALVGSTSPRERAGIVAAFAGLVLLAVSLSQSTSSERSSVSAVGAWIVVSAVVAAISAGPGSRALVAGGGLGLASGVLYAAGDVGTKGVLFGGDLVWFVPAVLACYGVGFVVLQLGFQRGGALATAGLASLTTNALPILAGTALFSESLPAGAWGLSRAAAFTLVVAGAALLARPGHVAPAAAR